MPRIYTYETLVGQTFGRLTVIALHHTAPRSKRYWTCRCECGGDHVALGGALKEGKTRSCGCLHIESARAVGAASGPKRRKSTLIKPGDTFSKLTALEYFGDSFWACKCECGGERLVKTSELRSGLVTSCGCEWKMNVRGALHQRNFTHGHSHTPGYYNWKGMVGRCTNPNDTSFEKYSKIGVCDGLKKSPQALFDCIGIRPENLEIDRVDNNKGYHCGLCEECKSLGRITNLRWATRKQQLRNRSNNTLFKIGDETLCAAEWAERLELTRNQFIYRYRENRV